MLISESKNTNPDLSTGVKSKKRDNETRREKT